MTIPRATEHHGLDALGPRPLTASTLSIAKPAPPGYAHARPHIVNVPELLQPPQRSPHSHILRIAAHVPAIRVRLDLVDVAGEFPLTPWLIREHLKEGALYLSQSLAHKRYSPTLTVADVSGINIGNALVVSWWATVAPWQASESHSTRSARLRPGSEHRRAVAARQPPARVKCDRATSWAVSAEAPARQPPSRP